MPRDRQLLLEKLTGVYSSKKNYYGELQKKIGEIARRNTELEILHELAKSINVNMSLREIMDRVTEKLRQVMSFKSLSFFLLNQGRLCLEITVPQEETSSVLDRFDDIPGENSVFSAVVAGHQTLHLPELATGDYRYDEIPDLIANNIRSLVLAPIKASNQILGVLALQSEEAKGYTGTDLSFLEHLAAQLAVCIKNAALYGEVLRAKREWEGTFGAMTDLLALIDPEFNIVRCNKAVPLFFDLTEDQVLGRKCYQVFFAQENRCEHCPLEEAWNTGHRAFQQMRFPGGQILDVHAFPVFNDDNQLTGGVYYAKDVTTLVQSSRIIALGQMAAGVAHELNSPLTAIVGDAQILLRDTKEGTTAHELLLDVKNCGSRCRRIIQNLLAFSRQEEYVLAPTLVNEVVENALNLVRYQIEKTNITIAKNLGADLPPVLGNDQRLEQVIINLLLNARDAVEGVAGERLINVSTSFQPPDRVLISISDSGQGIPAEIMPNIFNPFFTTKKPGKGTGLGLSVSLGIVESHGGTIEVQTQAGKGGTFTINLPAAKERLAEGVKENATGANTGCGR
jgi:two-component system NtrC family sensor kinase